MTPWIRAEPPPAEAAGIPEVLPLSERRHDLDALRAFAMLLGIALHASLAYTTVTVWPVDDSQEHRFFDGFLLYVHGFRMPLFFVLSGFFTAMLWRKRGLAALLRHRLQRIFLPLLLFLVTIIPLSIAVMFGVVASDRARGKIPGSGSGDTIWAAARENDVASLERHLAAGAGKDQPEPKTQLRPLHWAALRGNTESVRLLLVRGAEVDGNSLDGSTPLLYAAFMRHPEIVALLLDHGAAVNAVNRWRSTPLDSAGAGWRAVAWVSGRLGVPVDRAAWEARGWETESILLQHGALRAAALSTKPETGESLAGRLRVAYAEFLQWPGFRQPAPFQHLWFLWFLCLLFPPFLLYAWGSERVRLPAPHPRWFRFPLVLCWVVPITCVFQWFQRDFGPDTSSALIPPPHILGLYGVYFFFGALYYDSRDEGGALGRWWWAALPLALLAVGPLGVALGRNPAGTGWARSLSSEQAEIAAAIFEALFAWLMIAGLIGLFRVICRRESATIRYLSDSAYWLYVAHLPLIFLAQHLVRAWDIPAFAKFGVVCASVTAVLLLSYEFAVRYSWIGSLLNGKRVRSGSTTGLAIRAR